MSNAELKIDLINQITNITDTVKLQEILQLLKFQNSKSVYILSEEEKKAILEAKNQISKGNVVSNEKVQEEICSWLNK